MIRAPTLLTMTLAEMDDPQPAAASELSPVWPPIAVADIPAASAGQALPLLADEDSGVLVVGSSAVVHVLQVFSRQRLWFSVPAHQSCTGYVVAAGTLYIQDGPVLSAWDLTTADGLEQTAAATGLCEAALNLSTGTAAARPTG